MAGALVGGAALGVAFERLVRIVVQQAKRIAGFKSELQRLETTLKDIKPKLIKITELKKVLGRSDEEEITRYLTGAAELVLKCSKVKWYNAYHKSVNAKRLIRLDNDLVRIFQVNAQADAAITGMEISIDIGIIKNKIHQLLAAGTGGLSGWCSVPGRPEHTVGLDVPLAELKSRMLKEETRVLVISAPGGCGKTTLAKMFCHDDDIKDVFSNIYYITVSRDSSMEHIARKLFGHFDKHDLVFQTEEEAKNQIENLLKRKIESDNMLLVLDDVWSESESESLIEDLKFNIPGFKILVTSRFSFQSFSSLYEMSFLNEKDARTLFCHSAFPSNGNPVNMPDVELVNEMVKSCKGLPLALAVVGASLRGQPGLKWETTLKRWSSGQFILESHQRLLHCLQTSIDALDGLPDLKECFLDLGSFPKDDRIASTALLDMWVELYGLDNEGMYASEKLLDLSLRNLVNLFPSSKDAGEIEGYYCRKHYVMQHDLLRELAIHLNDQKPIAERKRLFMEIHRNDFPTWLIEQTEQPMNARIISISTDEAFSSSWCDLNAPKVEVLILNIRSKNYTLPQFIKRMTQLTVLIVTGYGVYPTQIDNLHFLGSITSLRRIRFKNVSVSPSIQAIFALQNLKKLAFVTCKIGNALNEYPYTLPNLIELEIDRCYDLMELPEWLCSLVCLQKLSIINCHELDYLPSRLGSISNLQTLRLYSCPKLQELPKSIGSLYNLSLLDISDCSNISVLPEGFGELRGLTVLKMSGCHGLEDLPASVSKLSQLKDVICDEETSYLWESIQSEHFKVKINIVEENIVEDFKKIWP